MPLTIGLIVEDLPFAKFLEPSIRQLGLGTGVALLPALKVRGCRPRHLKRLYERVCARCDLVIVGADAKTGTRAVSYRRKARSLESLLGRDPRILPAVADPCVEAWLYCDAQSFADGIATGTGSAFRRPDHWPVPKSERQAKEQLGRLIKEGCAEAVPEVFEFAPEITARMDLMRAPNSSLAEWARAFIARIEGPTP